MQSGASPDVDDEANIQILPMCTYDSLKKNTKTRSNRSSYRSSTNSQTSAPLSYDESSYCKRNSSEVKDTNIDRGTCSRNSKEELRSSSPSSCKYTQPCINSHKPSHGSSSKDIMAENNNSAVDVRNSDPNLDSSASGDECEKLLSTKSTHSSSSIRSLSPSDQDKYHVDTHHGTETKLKAWEPLMKASLPLNSSAEKSLVDDSLRSP